MTRNDADFYVKFGSNATEWARGLDAQLAPAVKTLGSLQATMNRLDRQGERLKEKLARDLDARGGSSPGGTVAAGSGKAPVYIQGKLEEAADAAADMMTQISRSVSTLSELPDAVRRIMNQVHGIVNQGPGLRPDQARNVAGGIFATAGSPGSANAAVLGVIKAQERAARTTGPAVPATSISKVGTQAVNEAGFKRIVDAIDAQTKTLAAALKNVEIKGGTVSATSPDGSYVTATTAKKPKKSGKERALEADAVSTDDGIAERMAQIQSKVERLDKIAARVMEMGEAKLAGLEREFGKDSDEYRNLKSQLDKEMSGLKADRAKAEREETGKTRGQQSDERRGAAQKEREERPLISNKEIERRLRDQSWLATASDPNLPNMVGRKAGDFGGNDLREMRRVLGESGFETGIKSKDKLAVQAEKIVAAAQRMATVLGGALPENLRTEGFNKYRETEVGAGTARMLSMANDEVVQALVKQRQDSLDLLSNFNRGGGGRELSRGRREMGSGLVSANDRYPAIGPLPQNYSNLYGSGKGSYTREEVSDAERSLRELAPEMRELTTQLMRTPGFDPYDAVETRIKKGSTPEELDQANAARLVVTQLRQAAEEIDKAGRDFVNAGDKVEDLGLKIADIQNRLLTSANTPKGQEGYLGRGQERKLEAEQERLRVQQENAMRFRSRSRGEYGDLFDDPNYRSGLEMREESRRQRDLNAEERRANYQESSYSSLRGGTGRFLARRVPGLGFNTQDLYAQQQNISGKDQNKLNNAFDSFITRQSRFLSMQPDLIGPRREGDDGKLEKARNEMENAAVKLLNRIEKAFGYAPAFATLTDRDILNPENMRGEAARGDRRAAAEAAIKAPARTDEEKALRVTEDLARAEARLSDAREEASRAVLAARQKEEEFQSGLAGMSEPDRQAAQAARDRLGQAQTERNALENAFLYHQERDYRTVKDDGERYVMREPAVDAKVDTLGYPAQYGYAPPVDDERKRLDAEISELLKTISSAYPDNRTPEQQNDDFLKNADKQQELDRLLAGSQARIDAIADARGEGDLKENAGYHAAREEEQRAQARIAQLQADLAGNAAAEHKKLNDEIVFSAARVRSLEEEVEKLRNRAEGAAKAVAKATQAETEKETVVQKAADVDLDAKRAQYETARDLSKQYKAANAAAKAAKGTDAYAGLRANADAIKATPGYMSQNARQALYREISGGGTGGGGPQTAIGPGDDSSNILVRILAAINQVNTTLKGGVKVTAGKIQTDGGTVTGRSGKPRDAALVAAEDDLLRKNMPGASEALDAIAAERQAQEGKERTTAATKKQEAEQRRANRETAKASAEARELAQQEAQLAAALNLVGREALDAAADLKRVAAAGDPKAIAQAQANLYARVDADLFNKNISGTDRRGVAKTMLNANGPQINENELSSIRRTARAQNPAMMLDRGLADQVPDPDQSEFMQAFGNMFGNRGFWGRIVGSTGAFIVRNFAAGAVFGLTNSLQTVLDQALQTEMTFVRVEQALEATDKPIGSLRSDLMGISTDYGVALNDVYNSAASLQGLFENTADLAAATRVSTQLQVISGGALSAAEAVGVLASTYTAFAQGPNDPGFMDPGAIREGEAGLTRIADTLTLIQNELGVNIETTAEGISSMAGAAESLGLNFQETAVYVAQISKLTNQTGAASGEQFSRILGAAQTGRGRGALREALDGIEVEGRDLGAAMNSALADNDMGAVIENLMMGWDSLSKSQQSNVAVSIAGQRQMRSFQALMHDSAATVDLLSDSYHANGDAEDRMAALMKTLNQQVAVLMGNFQNLASALVQTGILNFFLVLFKGINETLELMNKFLSAFNEFAEANPLVGQLRDLATFAIGAAIAFKVLGASVTGLKGALAQQRASQLPDAALRPGGVTAPFSPKVLRFPTRAEVTDPNNPHREEAAYSYRQKLALPVARPGFGEFRGGAVGAPGRAVNFTLDRAVRVPLERTGRIIERGGVRYANSSNAVVRALTALPRGIGNAMNQGAQGLSMILQGKDPRGIRSAEDLTRGQRMAARAAGNRSLYADQMQYSSYSGRLAGVNQNRLQRQWAAGGMSEEDIARRSTAPRRSTLALARVQEGAARTADKLSGGLGKVGAGMAAVAGSGLAFEAMLAGVGLGIAALVAYGARMKEFRAAFEESAKTFELPKKPGEEDSTPNYLGAADQATREAAARYRNDGVGYMENLGSSLRNKDFWTGSPKGALDVLLGGKEIDSQRSQREFVGIDSDKMEEGAKEWMARLQEINEELAYTFVDDNSARIDSKGRGVKDQYALEGVNEAGKIYTDTIDALNRASTGQSGYISDAISDVNTQFLKDLEAEKTAIENDATKTDAQKTAALAVLESLRSDMTREIANARAMAEGLGQTVALTSDQLANLSGVMSLGNTIAAGGGTVGGINLNDVLRSEIAGVGAEQGSDLQKMLDKLATGGLNTAQMAKADVMALQIAVKNARANYFAALEMGPGTEEFSTARSDLMAAVNELATVAQQKVNDILADAETLAGIAEASGNYAKAAAIRAKAILQAEGVEATAAEQEIPNGGVDEMTPGGMQRPPSPTGENEKGKRKRRKKDPAYTVAFEGIVNNAIYLATRDIELQIAQTSDQAVIAGLRVLQAQITNSILTGVNSGAGIDVDALPPKVASAIGNVPQAAIDEINKNADQYGAGAGHRRPRRRSRADPALLGRSDEAAGPDDTRGLPAG